MILSRSPQNDHQPARHSQYAMRNSKKRMAVATIVVSIELIVQVITRLGKTLMCLFRSHGTFSEVHERLIGKLGWLLRQLAEHELSLKDPKNCACAKRKDFND